jgi:DNA polymerase I-like protein with 3'-5' exonuclease and polymerase domains
VKTWGVDAEWGFRGGADRCPGSFCPVIFCAICAETGERYSFWGRDRGLSRFVHDHRGDLFVSHNLIAEAAYMMRMGVEPPPNWWDTMLGWRYDTNSEVPPPFALLDVLAELGLAHPFGSEKKALEKKIGALAFDANDPAELRLIRDYCLADCQAALDIYRRLIDRVPDEWMRCATEYALVVARIELHGIPIDIALYTRIMERRTEIVEAVTAIPNRTREVFINGALSRRRFLGWCADNGVGWPCTRSTKTGLQTYSLERKTFERMKDRHPFIQAVHESNKTCKQLLERELAVDFVTGRHYHGAIPYAQTTGRTSPVGSLLTCPRWMRFLIVPPAPGWLIVTADFDAQEAGIGAYQSGDRAMLDGYVSGDAHMYFAILAGAAPPGATDKTHHAIRKKYKTVNLAVGYGQTAFGLAQSKGMHYEEAAALLDQHRRVFAAYWRWVDAYTVAAYRRGVAYTPGGWRRKVTRRDNHRSVSNFPIQGCGGDLLRPATVAMVRQGLRLLTTCHDGFIFECRQDELPDLKEAVNAALRQAVSLVLPGAPLTWTFETFADRYRDEDGAPLWRLVNDTLRAPRKSATRRKVHS